MKLLYKNQHEGVWFSKNGHAAYLRGEKPLMLWHGESNLTATVFHHIALLKGHNNYTRDLVMFYRKTILK